MFEEMLDTIRLTACRFIMLIEIETRKDQSKNLEQKKTIRERLRNKVN